MTELAHWYRGYNYDKYSSQTGTLLNMMVAAVYQDRKVWLIAFDYKCMILFSINVLLILLVLITETFLYFFCMIGFEEL